MANSTLLASTAVIEPGAQIGEGVRVGPFCHVGSDVVLEDGVELISHVVVTGATTIGERTRVFPQAVLGCEPQSTGHKGGRTTLTIGSGCTIREGVTMHVGTDFGRGQTTVGDNGMFMANSHVAHDCIVGSNVTLANGCLLAGHCEIGDFTAFGGMAGVHQFARIGHHAFIGGLTGVSGDVIPYAIAMGGAGEKRAGILRGLNVVGIKRAGISHQELRQMRKAYSMLFEEGHPLTENAQRILEAFPDSAAVADIAAFVSERQKRHFSVPRRTKAGGIVDEDG